jgi:hypothetical protein
MSNGPGPDVTEWAKSTYSGGEGGNCVEWSPTYANAHGIVPVRDSKNPRSPLAFHPAAFSHFITAIQRGEIV